MRRKSDYLQDENFSLFGVLLFFLTLALIATGWIMNIIALTHASINPLTTVVILRFVGIIVAPLGAFMGWFVH